SEKHSCCRRVQFLDEMRAGFIACSQNPKWRFALKQSVLPAACPADDAGGSKIPANCRGTWIEQHCVESMQALQVNFCGGAATGVRINTMQPE
ncbi:hypothetical protein, partial [Methylobrevis pamukkalensis]|uniref:hypothetical protein n=1 Tax=Methylobrevis pamukkalensis TaxID=1439726 RepID=UPI001AECF434